MQLQSATFMARGKRNIYEIIATITQPVSRKELQLELELVTKRNGLEIAKAMMSSLTLTSSSTVSRSGANDFSATNKSIQARKQCQHQQQQCQTPPSSSVLVLLSAPSTLNRGDSSIKRTNGKASQQPRDLEGP